VYRLALIADGLSDRDNPDAVLGELPKIKFLLKRLAKEPAVTLDKDQFERPLSIAGARPAPSHRFSEPSRWGATSMHR